MNVRLVFLKPTAAAEATGRPSLTPELLAAVMARYSRNNEGLDAILAKVFAIGDDAKAVDGIFKMIDYGHASIGDMAPVAMFIDGVSIWLAYLVWSLCPTRVDLPVFGDIDGEDEMLGGQESSTRYIRLEEDGLPTAAELGIGGTDDSHVFAWPRRMEALFAAYRDATAFWEKHAQDHPEAMRLPKSLLEDPSEKAAKQVARMRRNYAFDRSRYFLPVAAKTNMAMVMPARTWATLCQFLLSSTAPEQNRLGELIREELGLAAPNLLRHAIAKDYTRGIQLDEFNQWKEMAQNASTYFLDYYDDPAAECLARLETLPPDPLRVDEQFVSDLRHHTNRYAPFGRSIRNTAVRFGWTAVAFAEIRDLNRHRTGQKDVPPVPQGFYCALDQVDDNTSFKDPFFMLPKVGAMACLDALQMLKDGQDFYPYFLPLGCQFPFSHLTTADKYLYEAELRTGTGAHFRYAAHLRSSLSLWYKMFPRTKGLVLEGSAEPE